MDPLGAHPIGSLCLARSFTRERQTKEIQFEERSLWIFSSDLSADRFGPEVGESKRSLSSYEFLLLSLSFIVYVKRING